MNQNSCQVKYKIFYLFIKFEITHQNNVFKKKKKSLQFQNNKPFTLNTKLA